MICAFLVIIYYFWNKCPRLVSIFDAINKGIESILNSHIISVIKNPRPSSSDSNCSQWNTCTYPPC